MRKYMMALAATTMLASQAEAATISGPTTVQAGVSYNYSYQTDVPAQVLPGYTLFTMWLQINGGDPATGGGGVNYWGTKYTDGDTFSFDWVFPTIGPASLTIRSVLVTYTDATIEQFDGYFAVNEGPNKKGLPFNSGFDFEGGGGPPATLEISVVPIGGTLPLLISAMAALGWVARRRRGPLPA